MCTGYRDTSVAGEAFCATRATEYDGDTDGTDAACKIAGVCCNPVGRIRPWRAVGTASPAAARRHYRHLPLPPPAQSPGNQLRSSGGPQCTISRLRPCLTGHRLQAGRRSAWTAVLTRGWHGNSVGMTAFCPRASAQPANQFRWQDCDRAWVAMPSHRAKPGHTIQ